MPSNEHHHPCKLFERRFNSDSQSSPLQHRYKPNSIALTSHPITSHPITSHHITSHPHSQSFHPLSHARTSPSVFRRIGLRYPSLPAYHGPAPVHCFFHPFISHILYLILPYHIPPSALPTPPLSRPTPSYSVLLRPTPPFRQTPSTSRPPTTDTPSR